MGLIIFIESARSLLQLERICLAARKLEDKSPLTIEGLVFGSDDFVADIGATRTQVHDLAKVQYRWESILIYIFFSKILEIGCLLLF